MEAYDRSKFRSIRDTIPRNFVTQLLFPAKFTFVSPFVGRKQVVGPKEEGGRKCLGEGGATDFASLSNRV